MTIARKGSRRIVVEGVAYRWTVRSRPTYSQGLTWGPLSFAVALEDAGGSTLVVSTDVARPDNWVGERGGAITPAFVERAIRQALREGWLPTKTGSPHALAIPFAPG